MTTDKIPTNAPEMRNWLIAQGLRCGRDDTLEDGRIISWWVGGSEIVVLVSYEDRNGFDVLMPVTSQNSAKAMIDAIDQRIKQSRL